MVLVTEEIVPVTPAQPPNTTVRPDWNPLPLMLKGWFEFDPVMGFGVSEEITGATDGAVTWSETVLDAWPPELTTCTEHVRAAVPTFTET